MSLSAPAHRKPALVAAVFFAAVAVLVARLAVAPLGPADLLGIAACAAAAGVFATLAFIPPSSVRAPKAETHPHNTEIGLRPADLEEFAARMETRLAATVVAALADAEETRRAEIRASVAASTPPRQLDTDAITSAGAKPRLGRGLLGLMHAPAALATTAKPVVVAAPATNSSATGPGQDERAAA